MVAIWLYDKRRFLGEDFIYFGQGAVSGTEGDGAALVAYATQVLDALGIRHGAAHAEIILTPTGPCLVEIGCRPQGNEGQPSGEGREGERARKPSSRIPVWPGRYLTPRALALHLHVLLFANCVRHIHPAG